MRAKLYLVTGGLNMMPQIKINGEIWQVTRERSFVFRNLTLHNATRWTVAIWLVTFAVCRRTIVSGAYWRQRVVLWHHERWSVIRTVRICLFDITRWIIIGNWVSDFGYCDNTVRHFLVLLCVVIQAQVEVKMRHFNLVAIVKHVFVEALRHDIGVAIERRRRIVKGTKFWCIIIFFGTLWGGFRRQHLVDAFQLFSFVFQLLFEIEQARLKRFLFIVRQVFVDLLRLFELLDDVLFVLDLMRERVDVLFIFLY